MGKTKLAEDANPQWRRMAWSDDGQVIAVSYSTGAVSVFDIMCGEFFTLNRVRTFLTMFLLVYRLTFLKVPRFYAPV